ncbi:MAG: ABC-type uncharacterized transport system YnjBCD permease subunit, partial [Limisphaerales bacterium]
MAKVCIAAGEWRDYGRRRSRNQITMSDKMMMTIAHAINDVVLVVLKTPEILEPVGITQEKFFAKVLGYDETGLWVQFPDFE